MDARHWVEQGHVLGPVERQPLSAVMVHHLRDAGKDAAALVQGVAVFFSLGHDDVDAALARPRSTGGEKERKQAALPTASDVYDCYQYCLSRDYFNAIQQNTVQKHSFGRSIWNIKHILIDFSNMAVLGVSK